MTAGGVREARWAGLCALLWASTGCLEVEPGSSAAKPADEQAVDTPDEQTGSGELGRADEALGQRRIPGWPTDECGRLPDERIPPDTTGKNPSSHGFVELTASAPNQFKRLKTQLTVPSKPPPSGTIFLWPGLQPLNGAHYYPIDNGVLQPVLTWGPSCAPGSPTDHASWWISAQYVNVFGREPGYTGCQGGPVMRVEPGETLQLEIARTEGSTRWVQTVTRLSTGQRVSYTIDMRGQEQGRAIFDIELPTGDRPTEDVVFSSTVLTYDQPLSAPCTPVTQGANDYVTRARLSADRLRCCIRRIALRAAGVPATTQP